MGRLNVLPLVSTTACRLLKNLLQAFPVVSNATIIFAFSSSSVLYNHAPHVIIKGLLSGRC